MSRQSRSSAEGLVVLLRRILESPFHRRELVSEFQRSVWDGMDVDNPTAIEVLRELAYDLDYFVDDPAARRDDPSYFGHDRLEAAIHDGLRRLREAGIDV